MNKKRKGGKKGNHINRLWMYSKKGKKQQLKKPHKEEKKAVYSWIAQNMEKTRDIFWRSMSRASTISTEEKQMALTEKEFDMIRQKMDED